MSAKEPFAIISVDSFSSLNTVDNEVVVIQTDTAQHALETYFEEYALDGAEECNWVVIPLKSESVRHFRAVRLNAYGVVDETPKPVQLKKPRRG